MGKIYHIIFISFFCFKINSCAEIERSSESLNYSHTKQVLYSAYDILIGNMLASNENSFSPEQFSTDKVQNSNPKDRNIFLVKHDSYGSREWIKDLGISDEESGVSMSFDASDNVYLTGYKINSLEGNKDLRDFSVFLIKYNSLGRRVWIKKMGNSTVKDGARLIVDSSENIYVTGFYDEFESRNTLLVKYNTSGNRAWTKILGSKLTDFAWDVTVDSNNNICVARLSGDSFLQNINRQDDVLLTKFNTDGVKL